MAMFPKLMSQLKSRSRFGLERSQHGFPSTSFFLVNFLKKVKANGEITLRAKINLFLFLIKNHNGSKKQGHGFMNS